MHYLFLIIAVVGVAPWINFYRWFQAEGWAMQPMIDAWFVNEATTGIAWDLTIAAGALTLWILIETFQQRDPIRLLAIPAIFGIGVSCGLPLYLYFRMRPSARAGRV